MPSSSLNPVRWFAWPRLRVAMAPALAVGLLFGWGWKSGMASLLLRACLLGWAGLAAFGLLEAWPRRLPAWLARWALQVVGVAVVMPVVTLAVYLLSTPAGAPPFWKVPDRWVGFLSLAVLGTLVGPWMALAALVRQKEALARDQALAFDLARSEYERQALDARLRLLQAQVQPHFLFNTLANVRELVDTGSPTASSVLGSLIAYLRAAVPSLHEPFATLEQELGLVRAYLEIMHMRMPDRLAFSLEADEEALPLRCPPLALLTLVENAVRHGLDPSEEGGRIEVRVAVAEGRCRAEVLDTGVGLSPGGEGTGTGLANLRERLRLAFPGEAHLELGSAEPGGTLAVLSFPALRSAP